MIPIDMYTVGVESESELRSAVGSGTINYIYLAVDITITSQITIDAAKTSLVIDGEYPQNSGTIHRLTDMNSTAYGDTIGIRETSSIALTFKNMVINGRNYYGVPYIIESIPIFVDTSGVSVIYENVTYTGPQITYNRYGLTRYIDCDITITQTGVSPAEEVGEVCRVEIGGTTTIRHNIGNGDDGVFWFNNSSGASSLTILSGAQVDITSINSYFMYNYENGLTFAPVSYTLQSNANLRLQVNKGISYNQNHTVRSFLVNENASFHYVQTANNGTVASIYLNGPLEVGQGANFYMQASNGTQPLIRYTTGTNLRLNVDNAKSFVLYSPNAAALYAQSTTTFSLHGGQVNTWSTATVPVESAGGLDDIPEYKWFKREYAQPVELNGTFTQTATTATSNLVTEDEPHPLNSDLRLQTARVISLGDWPFTVNPVVSDGRPVSGQTEPNANMRVRYSIGGNVHTINGTADGSGVYSLSTSEEVPSTIPVNTDVTVWSNIPFLIKSIIRRTVEVGELAIVSAPVQIVYRPSPIAFGPPLLPRTNPEEQVVISDTRADESQWDLFVSITGPLQAPTGETLIDAVVFLETDGGVPVTLSGEPIAVFRGGPGVVTTNVFWTEREGILARITGTVRSGARYTTYLIWEVRPV